MGESSLLYKEGIEIMSEISNIYVEKIAESARKEAVEKRILGTNPEEYSWEVLESIIKMFGGELLFNNDISKREAVLKHTQIGFEVYVNGDNKPEDLPMAVLHGLGLEFLYTAQIQDGEKIDDSQNMILYSKAELFARSFLMPADHFVGTAKRCITEGKFDVQKVADTYKVEYVIALIRGKELNFWD